MSKAETIEDYNRSIIKGHPVKVEHDYQIRGYINNSLADRLSAHRAMTKPYTADQYDQRVRRTRTRRVEG
jgi:hypothetical protein